MNNNIEKQLQQQIQNAYESNTALRIVGGNSKAFYGLPVAGDRIDVSSHQGIINYQPSELVMTARAGTPLTDIETALAEHNQMLAFEPPHYSASATLGGCIASGLAGPARASAGSVRDFVLGMTIINGQGELLHFGGEVMKNVAGYDLSRLLTGSLGTLGLILEVSLKILPRPRYETTVVIDCNQHDAIQLMNQWAGKPLPISGSCFYQDKLFIRLAGYQQSVLSSVSTLKAKIIDADNLWHELKEQQHAYFNNSLPLWRLSLPSTADTIDLAGDSLIEWGGAQRWCFSNEPADKIFALASQAGGHATLFKSSDKTDQVFQPLQPQLMKYHQRVKTAMDAKRILNPGRMYKDL